LILFIATFSSTNRRKNLPAIIRTIQTTQSPLAGQEEKNHSYHDELTAFVSTVTFVSSYSLGNDGALYFGRKASYRLWSFMSQGSFPPKVHLRIWSFNFAELWALAFQVTIEIQKSMLGPYP